MHTLLFVAALATQDVPYPVLEKDPWQGFMPGSYVVRESNVDNRIKTETTITLKSIEVNSKTFTILSRNEEDEQNVEFASFTAMLVANGFRASGKSTRVVPFGPAKVKAQVRELSMEGDTSGTGVWKLTVSDEIPGGLYEAVWSSDDEKTSSGVSCVFKAVEKLKVQGKDVSCARFDVKETQRAKSKKTSEGSYWLSAQIPGLLVKSVLKVTEGKDVTETTIQTLKFDVKK